MIVRATTCERSCQRCGVAFIAGRQTTQIYCTEACRSKAHVETYRRASRARKALAAEESEPEIVHCVRCGVVMQRAKSARAICRDCVEVKGILGKMTANERRYAIGVAS